VAGFREHGKEPSVSLQTVELLSQLSATFT